MEIETLPVSHSLEGATAYIIHTEKGPIVYTGDFRFHGYKGHLTREFIKRAADVEPIALITEGTRIDSNKEDSEEDVKDNVMGRVEQTTKFILSTLNWISCPTHPPHFLRMWVIKKFGKHKINTKRINIQELRNLIN